MPKHQPPFLRLVVNRSIHIDFPKLLPLKKPLRDLDSALAAQPRETQVVFLGNPVVGPKVADRLHGDAEKPCGVCRPTEDINEFRNSHHASIYSDQLKKVKMQTSEWDQSRGIATFGSVMEMSELSSRELIGLRLRAARKAIGKTQASVCEDLGVSTNKWNQWEMGRHLPDILFMVSFSDNYGISLDWIFREKTDHLYGHNRDHILTIYQGLLAERAPRSA